MGFSTDVAKLVADQLTRHVTLDRRQLAGHVANLDFWLAEVRHALAVIDGYGERFVRMQTAQEHLLVEPVAGYKVPALRRVPDHELRRARQELVEAATRFLTRCGDEGLISGARLVTARGVLGSGA